MSLPATMRALQLRQRGALEEMVLPRPTPGPGEALVRTEATTICTSDLVDIAHCPFGTELPRILGHEGAGTIVALGPEACGWQVGDRVAAHPVISCGVCPTCRRGLEHLCERMGHLGIDRDGTCAEYFCLPVRRLRRIPDALDSAVAALLEPVCVCLEALRRARVAAGQSLLVAGDGPFGQLIARLALREHPARLIVTGKEPFRLRRIPEAICLDAGEIADVVAAVRDANGGDGVDAAILAVADVGALNDCLRSLRPRGCLVVFAALVEPAPVDLFRVHLHELEIRGACNDEDYLDEALPLLGDPHLGLERVVTHRIPFAAWRDAFALAAEGKDRALKVALTFDETRGGCGCAMPSP